MAGAQDAYDFTVRMVVIGDAGVGKTSLILRFVENKFSATFVSTIGVDFHVKTVTMTNGRLCKILVWDTAGQERFRNIVSNYYRGAEAALITYDVTRRSTFESVRGWIDEMDRYNPRLLRNSVLCATKMDMPPEHRIVTRAEGEALANEFGLDFFETSSKEDVGEAVQRMFIDIAARTHAHQLDDLKNDKAALRVDSTVIVDGADPQSGAFRCCVLL